MSLILGFASGADTLCSQAFGFKNYKRVGVVLQRGILILTVAVLPAVCLWLNTESVMLLLQQDPCVAKLTGEYVQVFILSLPGIVVLIMVQRYLLAQGVVWVFVLSGILSNVVSVVLHAVFLFGAKLGVVGASLALTLINTVVPVVLLLYIRARGLHKLTWGGWSWASLQDWAEYAKLGLGGFALTASEWWAFEVSVLVTGSIDKTQLAVNTVVIQLATIIYMVPLGMGIAVSVRVGNELGAGNPLRAKRASFMALGVVVCSGTVFLVLFGSLRRQLAYVFTNVSEVVDGVEHAMVGALGVVFLDQIQGTIAGILRGSGRQGIGAAVNIVCFYLIGLPLGISLAIPVKMGSLGMWIGLSVADVIQTTTLIGILLKTNWKKLSDIAIMRATDGCVTTGKDSDVNSTDVDPNNSIAMDSPVATQDEDEVSLSSDSEAVPLVSADDSDDQSQEAPITTQPPFTLKPKMKLVIFKGSFFLVGALLIIAGAILTQYHPCAVAATGVCSNCSSSCCDVCTNDSVCLLEPAASVVIQPTPTTVMTSFMPSAFVTVSQHVHP